MKKKMLQLSMLLLSGLMPFSCNNPGSPDVKAARALPVAVTIVAAPQTSSTYRLTITGPDMKTIGPNEYAGGQTIELYVPQGIQRLFYLERYDANMVLSDTGSFRKDIGSGINEITKANIEIRLVNLLEPDSIPEITLHPVSHATTVGHTVTFFVEVYGAHLQYQWQKDSTDIPGATKTSYTTPVTTPDDDGSLFRCKVSNSAGSKISNSATLTVAKEVIAPFVTTHPDDQSVTEGQTATFSIEASGTDLEYQWQKDSTDIPGATKTTYTTPVTTPDDDGSLFRCKVNNSAGSKISNTATLTVAKEVIAPSITTHPDDQSVTEGQAATFSIEASGTDLEYQWQKDSTDIPGATKITYTTPVTTPDDDGSLFRCKVSNSAGSKISNTATLTVAKEVIAPSITTHPDDQSVTEGQTATFSIEASGTDLEYQWQKDSTDIPGATKTTYTTPATTLDDDGSIFRCKVSNSAGSKISNTATLTVAKEVIAPSIITHPDDQSVTEGQTAIFSIEASGTDLEYQWQKDSTDIPGATKTTYTTPATTLDDDGSIFRCKVNNSAGSKISNTATLTVAEEVIAPSIITHPDDQSVTEGQAATFSIEASGTDLEYQWQKDSTDIPGATKTTYTTPATTLDDDGSIFRCKVNNSAGSKISNTATLTVAEEVIAPSIMTHPDDQSVTEGQTATFSIEASGTDLEYQWQKDSTDITGATKTSYTTPEVTLDDDGSFFRCKVSNSAGTRISNSATLSVSDVPIEITGQPDNKTVLEGQTALFSVSATGTNLIYQWQKNGGNISGAKSHNYTTPVLSESDDGNVYRCVVSNSTGSVKSDSALLKVIVSPSISSQPSDTIVTLGQTAKFSVSVTGTYIKYQWQRNSVNITGATSSSYTTPSTVSSDDISSYRCVVSNAGDTVTSVAAKLRIKFKVTYDGNGNTGGTPPSDPDFYLAGETVSVLGMNGFVNSGCDYAGWNSLRNGTGEVLSGTFTMPSNNYTLYARWTVTDFDGNVYNTVRIGSQTWIVENLKTTHFNDGTPIDNITDSIVWGDMYRVDSTAAYCWYCNNSYYKDPYGALYNWWAVKTNKLAPPGWHIATETEWDVLISNTGGGNTALKSLKEAGTAHWGSPNDATNESGFTALPGGARYNGFNGVEIGIVGWFWTSSLSPSSALLRMCYRMHQTSFTQIPVVYKDGQYPETGLSVRCIKD